MYGKALIMSKQPIEALEKLQKAKNIYSSMILYISIGDAYKDANFYSSAEQAYIEAWCMAPMHFYPMYLLVKLYEESNQHEKAVVLAEKLLSKNIKVNSTAIKEMQNEVRKITKIRK
jgi:tetratricopeptide (TPR) repeat protein